MYFVIIFHTIWVPPVTTPRGWGNFAIRLRRRDATAMSAPNPVLLAQKFGHRRDERLLPTSSTGREEILAHRGEEDGKARKRVVGSAPCG